MSMNCIIALSQNQALVDPLWDKVVLLMNMDGPSIVDVKGHPMTSVGTVGMSSAQPKFGNYSLACNGAGYLTTPDSEDWNVGNGDFTLEAWVYQVSRASNYGAYQGILQQAQLGQYTDGSFDFSLNNGTPNGNMHGGGANAGQVIASSGVSLFTWTHVCYERFGDTFSLYIDGVLKGSNTTNIPGVTAINSTRVLAIGADPTGQAIFNGYLGPLRFTKGASRYKGAFQVPTGLFPTS